MKITAFLAALVIAIPAQATPSQFNLICEGTRDNTKNVSRTIRVDLTANKWCTEECKIIKPLAKVTADRLTFEDSDKPSQSGLTSIHFYVERETGDMAYWITIGRITSDEKAICKPVTFTGFPVLKTLF